MLDAYVFATVTSKLDFFSGRFVFTLFVCWRSASVFFNFAVGSNASDVYFCIWPIVPIRLWATNEYFTLLTDFFDIIFFAFVFIPSFLGANTESEKCVFNWIKSAKWMNWRWSPCTKEFFIFKNSNYLTESDTRITFSCIRTNICVVVVRFIWPIHKSVSVSFPLPFSGRLWFIDRKCIHIKMLLKNLLCYKLISFMSFYMRDSDVRLALNVHIAVCFLLPLSLSFIHFGRDWCWSVAYCLSVGFITPFVSYAAVFKWFVISCWYLLFKFPSFTVFLFVLNVHFLPSLWLAETKKNPIKIGIPYAWIGWKGREKNEESQ